MALNTDHRAPPRHFRPQSERQRRAVLAAIDAAERETLDSEPTPLTADPYLLRTERAQALAQAKPRPGPYPLRMIKPAQHKRPAPIEQYQEAERIHAQMMAIEALLKQPVTDLEPMPVVDHKLRRIVWTGLALYMLGMVVAGIWAFTG